MTPSPPVEDIKIVLAAPFSAYQRWARDGNTADADRLQAWDDARDRVTAWLAAVNP